MARYRASLSDERRQLLARFRPHDAARKVVGVGSVGTRCYVVLLLSDRHDDPLLLQVKQATASVLERYAGRSRYRHPGRRVVNRPGRPGPLRPAVRLGPGQGPCPQRDGATISGYLGTGDRFDRAVADIAEAYADQTEADYAAFTRARGSAPAEGGRGRGTNQRKGDGG
jgi:hypothetical protein